MIDDEYLLDIRIKNNVLYKRIISECKSVKEFAKKYTVSLEVLYKLLNFKQNLYNKKGRLLQSVQNVCDKLQCEIEDIIPSNYNIKDNNRFLKEVDIITMSQLADMDIQYLLEDYSVEESHVKSEMKESLDKALSTLRPREAEILRSYYCDDETQEEIAIKWNVTPQRIKQIIEKGLEKLRNPSRSKKLASYMPNPSSSYKRASDMYTEAKQNNYDKCMRISMKNLYDNLES